MNDSGVLRTGIFIDGRFLEVVRDNCRRDRKQCPTLSEFVQLVSATVLRWCPDNSVRVDAIEVHWFAGEFKEAQARKRWRDDPRELERHLSKECKLQQELSEAGIIQHRRDMQPRNGPQEDNWSEKGIDTWLLAEALDFAETFKPDAMVLVACDGDHITLLEWMRKRQIATILVYYDSPEDGGRDTLRTQTHWWLKKFATQSFMIDLRDGFALRSQDDMDQAKCASVERAFRFRHEQAGIRPCPGVPFKSLN